MPIELSHSKTAKMLFFYRCESGDLSNKHGQLEFSPLSPTRKTYTYIDPNLQLKGSFGSKQTELHVYAH